MKVSAKISVILLAAIGFTGLNACKSTFDISPENAIDYKRTYQNIYDADAAVTGVYGQLLGIAGQYEILNELRADLMDVTGNADVYLKQLSTNNVTSDNPYINPKAFYGIIGNCNDVLKNLKEMYEANKINESNYQQRYSDVGALRTWLYFQLAIHFGEIPYVTEPVVNIYDLQDEAKFPKKKLDELVPELIKYMEALPYKKQYADGSSLVTQVDGYPSKMMFINKLLLLGDMYLFTNQYNTAAKYYKDVLETTTPLGESAPDGAYWNFYSGSSGGDNDAATPSAWKNFFSRSPQDKEYQWEWLWTMFFDKGFRPENPFVSLFSNTGAGKYLVKPSQSAINNWNTQVQSDGTPFDLRGPNNSYKMINGQPVIMKFLYNYLNANTGIPSNPLEKNGKWFLYRASLLHLRYAEAANRDGQTKLAYAILNNGVKSVYDDLTLPAIERRITKLPYPYDMDARKLDAPRVRGKFHRQLGLRARVATSNLPAALQDNSKMLEMEDAIMDEAALEVAYEGNRWQDLVRIALRREKSTPGDGLKFINDKLAAKSPGVKPFNSIEDLFLPLKW